MSAYTTLEQRIARITHRSDLSSQMAYFIDDANQMIQARLGLDLVTPSIFVSDNQVATDNINLYLYAGLISAYEYINEIDMAQHYRARWEDEVSTYYITSTSGRCPDLVMGKPICEAAEEVAPPVTDNWILAAGVWNDNGVWNDAAQWIDG